MRWVSRAHRRFQVAKLVVHIIQLARARCQRQGLFLEKSDARKSDRDTSISLAPFAGLVHSLLMDASNGASKMTAEKIHTMTSSEIRAFVFAGASTTEPRSLRERIGDDALSALPSHPAWNDFPRSLQDWVFADIDAMLSE